jgi:hypothetical protein
MILVTFISQRNRSITRFLWGFHPQTPAQMPDSIISDLNTLHVCPPIRAVCKHQDALCLYIHWGETTVASYKPAMFLQNGRCSHHISRHPWTLHLRKRCRLDRSLPQLTAAAHVPRRHLPLLHPSLSLSFSRSSAPPPPPRSHTHTLTRARERTSKSKSKAEQKEKKKNPESADRSSKKKERQRAIKPSPTVVLHHLRQWRKGRGGASISCRHGISRIPHPLPAQLMGLDSFHFIVSASPWGILLRLVSPPTPAGPRSPAPRSRPQRSRRHRRLPARAPRGGACASSRQSRRRWAPCA